MQHSVSYETAISGHLCGLWPASSDQGDFFFYLSQVCVADPSTTRKVENDW